MSRRSALIVLALMGGACRGMDDQETRPLPPPERPPHRSAELSIQRSPRPSEPVSRTPARAPEKARPVIDAPRNAPGEVAPEANQPPSSGASETPPTSAAAGGPTPESSASVCQDRCQKALALCVTAPTDAPDALETCKAAFESCKSGC